MNLGYTRKQVINMGKKFPMTFTSSLDKFDNKISILEALGHSREKIIYMTANLPAIFSYSEDNLRNKIDDIIAMGYTKKEVLRMLETFPALYGLTIEKIREKKEFYDSIGLSELFIKKPAMFIQSIELSYARYMFYKSIGIEITMDNYLLLFWVQSKFKNSYKISNDELMEIYSYDECLLKNDVKTKKKLEV